MIKELGVPDDVDANALSLVLDRFTKASDPDILDAVAPALQALAPRLSPEQAGNAAILLPQQLARSLVVLWRGTEREAQRKVILEYLKYPTASGQATDTVRRHPWLASEWCSTRKKGRQFNVI